MNPRLVVMLALAGVLAVAALALSRRGTAPDATRDTSTPPAVNRTSTPPPPPPSTSTSTSSSTGGDLGFPAPRGVVTNAKDVRGKPAPEFAVARWLTPEPDIEGKVVLLDFWATWCGPCVASIPHMNRLAEQFTDDVAVIGVSNETETRFQQGIQRLERAKGISLESFRYPIALDPAARMQRAIGIRGIPHCVIVDSNWVVRWQGHPSQLHAEMLEQIVRADRAARG